MKPGPTAVDSARQGFRPAAVWLLYILVFGAVSGVIQGFAGSYRGDLNVTADESAHFTSSAMIHDYLVGGKYLQPLKFAMDYYYHFPRVAIGHWPPLFHILQALLFIGTGPTVVGAMIFQLLIAAATCATVGVIVARRSGWTAGLCSGAALLVTTQFMFSFNTVMLDNFVGLLILLAALAWSRYAQTGSAVWSAGFGICAAAAILTKGNAYGLAFVPIFHAILARRSDLLLAIRTYIAAVVVMVLTIPWYLLTYKMAAGGFRYSWGLAYTSTALMAFAGGMPNLLGDISFFIFLLMAMIVVVRAWQKQRDEIALSCLTGAIGIFVFICLVPADVSPRYLVDLLPCVFLSMVLGLDGLIRQGRPGMGAARRGTVVSAVLILNMFQNLTLPHRATLRLDEAAGVILRSQSDNPLVLISGSARTEGALIAAFAEKDRMRSHFIIRASKAIASSDFMGRDYKLRFESGADLEHWLEESKIGWLVIVDVPLLPSMPHLNQVTDLAMTHPAQWTLVAEEKTDISDTRVFRIATPTPTAADVASVLKLVAPTSIAASN